MIYATDTELIKWRFKNVNHILLGVNYDPELLSGDDAKKNHVVRGHMSIDTACEFVKANASDQLQNVIMCHLSKENADAGKFIEKMKKVAYGANVDVAVAGKSWDLKNPSECPFQKGDYMAKYKDILGNITECEDKTITISLERYNTLLIKEAIADGFVELKEIEEKKND